MPNPEQIPGIYDPEGLYSAASDAGMVPPYDFGTRGTGGGGEPDRENPTEEAKDQYPDLLQGGLTPPTPWSDLRLSGGAMVPQEPGLKGEGTKTSQSYGTSTSAKFTRPQNISKEDRDLIAANQAGEAQVRAEAAPVQASLDAAQQQGVTAIDAQTKAQQDKIVQEGRDANVLKQINDGFMHEELQAHIRATAQENQAKTDYIAALNDFRASRVDPNQLWGSMSGGQRFGMLVSAFAHDFLGAKGIKTSAMDTLNRAIDRNIDSQVQAIKVKGEVTQGFKTLWEMQRAQSASDAEARARVRGFMLESVKQNLIATMAPYESALASANGKAALAKLDEAYAKNVLDVYGHITQNVNAMRQQNTSWAEAKLKARTEAYATSVHAADLAFRQKQYEDQRKAMGQIPEGDVIVDPESNRGKWVFKFGIGDAEKQKTREQMEGVQEVNSIMNDLRKLHNEITPVFDAVKGTRFATEQQRRYDAITTKLAHSMAKANGERATDKDIDQFLKSIPTETFFTRGGIDTILAYTQDAAIRPAYNKIQQVAKDLPEEQWTQGPVVKPFAASQADAKATVIEGSKAAKDAKENNPTDLAVQYMNAPDANDKANKKDYEKSGIDKDSFKLAWNDWQDKYAPPPSKGGDYQKRAVFAGKDEPPAWAVSIESLKEQALKGDKKAMEALAKEATDYRVHDAKYNDDSDRMIRQGWALYELHQIANTPHVTAGPSPEVPTTPQPPSPGPITPGPQSLKYVPKYRR